MVIIRLRPGDHNGSERQIIVADPVTFAYRLVGSTGIWGRGVYDHVEARRGETKSLGALEFTSKLYAWQSFRDFAGLFVCISSLTIPSCIRG